MRIETNIHGNRIGYENLYAEALNEYEKELYWSATERAEDALAKICGVQEHRIDEHGEIDYWLHSDEFQTLREAIEELNEAITFLQLIGAAAARYRRMEEERNSLLEKMENGELVGSDDEE